MLKVVARIGNMLLCLGALAFGSTAGWMSSNRLVDAYIRQTFGIVEEPFKGKDSLIVLLLGADRKRGYGDRVVTGFGRTDSVHLVRLDFKNNAIGMMSIPRDTIVDVPGYRTMRFNALYEVGGEVAAMEGVRVLTGIQPERTIILNYAAVEKMVDNIGGVEIFVEKKMKYDDHWDNLHIDFSPGRIIMDGKNAVAYMRYRKDSDFERSRRQQDFLVAFKQKVAADPSKLNDIANLACQLFDESLNDAEIMRLMMFGRGVKSNRIKQGMLPVKEGAHYNQYLDEEKLPEVLVKCGFRPESVVLTPESGRKA